jgi:hypothetical protein
MRNAYEILFGKDHSEDIGVRKWILGKQGGKAWTGFIWLRIGPVAGSCEHGNETSGSIKCGEFLD